MTAVSRNATALAKSQAGMAGPRAAAAHDLAAPFLRRIRSLAPATSREEEFLATLHLPVQAFTAGAQVRAEGDVGSGAWIVGAGWAARLRALPDGRRQIVNFLLPGDVIGLGEFQHAAAHCAIVAITDLKLLNAGRLAEAIERNREALPNLALACRKQLVLSQVQMLDQILRLGCLIALERMAHLLLELYHRMEDAGLARDGWFPFPLTQAQLGEALGLSLVHVNRTSQHLRRERLIELRPGRAAVLDRIRLAALCEFKKPVI